MRFSWVYLLLAIAGTVLPMSQFIPASIDGEFSVQALMVDSFATRNVAGLALDLAVAAMTGVVFLLRERNSVRGYTWIIPLVGTFLIGFSFGLPFFLFLRERQREKGESGA